MNDRISGTFEDELDAIRLKFYEETKGMSPIEEIAYFDNLTEPLIEPYHLIVRSPDGVCSV